jgi:hypothetical protein
LTTQISNPAKSKRKEGRKEVRQAGRPQINAKRERKKKKSRLKNMNNESNGKTFRSREFFLIHA